MGPTEAGAAGRLHFIGIGGAGMSVIAELFLARGRAVSGSDARGSAALDRLAALGADVHVGHAAEHVAGAQTVVVSTAVRVDNAELVAARTAGIPVIHRSEALALVAEGKDFVAASQITGEHWLRIMFREMLPNMASIVMRVSPASTFAPTSALTATTTPGIGERTSWPDPEPGAPRC